MCLFKGNAQECGTPDVVTNTNESFSIQKSTNAQFCVNIRFHIVRESNGTGGFDPTQIPSLINYINLFYNSHSINCASIGFDYIDNSALFNIDDVGNNSSEFNQLITYNNVSNAINFYIVNSANYNGRAGAILSNNLVVRLDKVFAPTSPHELGHCFNLLHTFQGTASGTSGCAENINGSNCSSCGDSVCDTPADANTGARNGFNPDVTNIMSYYSFRDHFTQLQGTRMRNAIGGSPLLQQTLGNQCLSISGLDLICPTSNYAFTIDNSQNSNITWSVTSNLQIINSSNSGITIKALNSETNGSGTITANINGILITKEIWIGKPLFLINQSNVNSASNIEFITLQGVNSNIQSQGITNVSWEVNSSTLPNCGYLAGSGFSGEVYYNISGCTIRIKITATNSCGATIQYKTINNNRKTGGTIGRESNQNIYTVFPNPSKDIININLLDQKNNPKKEGKIIGELFDLRGVLKSRIEILDNTAAFSVSGFSKGIYVLKIELENQIENHQIIVE